MSCNHCEQKIVSNEPWLFGQGGAWVGYNPINSSWHITTAIVDTSGNKRVVQTPIRHCPMCGRKLV